MRHFFTWLLMLVVTGGLLLQNAEAGRFGGGKSFGMQRSASVSRLQSPLQTARPMSSPSKWLGPLAGLAVGGLLASLFMGHGLGSGILSWLVILGVGFFLWNLLRSKMQPATQPQSFNAMREDTTPGHNPSNNVYPFASHHAAQYPAGFEPTEFLRNAKVQFIRLQAAYDHKDLLDLREFTAPEVFGEIQMQLQERGDIVNRTEVVTLEAELLDVSSEFQTTLASVRFSGTIRENTDEQPSSIREIWHFQKDTFSPKWIVTGVQQ